MMQGSVFSRLPPPTITGVSFDLDGTFTQFGVHTAPDGSDQWVMTEADDGEIYAVWGDGKGWAEATYYLLGITKITGTPPSLSGTHVYGNTLVNYKPLAIVADQSSVMKMFVTTDVDAWDGSYGASSTDRGSSWTYEGSATYSFLTDGLIVVGIAQFAAGYTAIPAGIDSNYYYIYLSARDVEETGHGPDIYLARCVKANIFTRAGHQYFAGFSGSNPTWSTFANKVAVLHDVDGMQYHFIPTWNPSLSRFIVSKTQPAGVLKMYEAFKPWGPFTLFHNAQLNDAFTKFTSCTPQRWMSGGGLIFWLSWSGYPEYDCLSIVRGTLALR